MYAFNNFIKHLGLRDIKRTGQKYTWTNKQEVLIQSNIDRVFICTSWEERFPLCVLRSLTRIGSDHCPLILNTEMGGDNRERQFFF